MEIGFSAGDARQRADAPAQAGIEHGKLDPRVAAWIAAAPAAALTIVAIVVLGPPLGAWLLATPHLGFWREMPRFTLRPEPTEQGRYLIALTAPLVLVALMLWLMRRAPRAIAARARAIALATEAAALLVVVACFVAQRLQAPQNYTGDRRPVVYFTLASIAVAVAIAVAIAAAVRSAGVRALAQRWLGESRARRAGALAVALIAIAIALLPAINTDESASEAFQAVNFHLLFTYDETMAVIDGRSPLGNFATQYAALWPYGLAAAMSVLGSGMLVFTGLLAALTGVTLLALYDILRRLTRSALAALALFLPLLATCGFRLHGPAVNRFSLINYYGVMPLRLAGPFLLAWLVTRQLGGARPRRLWPLFVVAGLVVLNNADFGLSALGATVAALVWAHARPGARPSRRALAEAAAGLAAALALVTALLLARTSSLPDLSLLLRYPHILAVGGFSMLPIRPLFGVDVAIFLTYVAAIGTATVRALRGERDRALTGMLAWSGVFGLGAGSYYVGHSQSELLIYTFPAWALSVTLLTLVTIRSLARVRRVPSPAQLACLAGFGLLVCSLAQTPAPWSQLRRISVEGPQLFAQPAGVNFVAQNATAGESVLIVALLGHRIAQTLGLHDVEPYTGSKSIFTSEQLRESLAALRAAHGMKVFVEPRNGYGSYAPVLRARFKPIAAGEGIVLWVAR
jgi:hypothetical protein